MSNIRNIVTYLSITIIAIAVFSIFLIYRNPTSTQNNIQQTTSNPTAQPSSITNTPTAGKVFSAPIDNTLSRVTKKPFGIKVSPRNSPVAPERFSGYHSGVDFETLSSEQNIDIKIYAICSGAILQKRWVSGYGGMILQKCTLEGNTITVVYGHLKLSSISASIGQEINRGEELGVLGKAYSSETDGERKHLHLGIHKGTTVDIRGYVQKESELNQWINVLDYL